MKTLTRRSPLLLTLLIMLTMTLPALAQDGGDRGGDRGGDWRQRWENMSEEERDALRKRMEERRAEYEKQAAEQMRERMKMSEDDFKLISPLIDKVRTAQRESESATPRGGRGGFGGRGFGGAEMSDDAKAATEALAELRQAIEDKDSGDIKQSLAKLRKARTALDKSLKDAREELRSVCTPQWEAEFVVMGLLD